MNKKIAETPIYIDSRHINGSGIGNYVMNLLKEYGQIIPDYPIKPLIKSMHLSSVESALPFRPIFYDAPIYSIREQFSWVFKLSSKSLLHTPHYNAPLFFRGKLLVTLHDICHLAMSEFFPGFFKKIYASQFLGIVLKRADHVITVSNFSKNEILKYFNIPADKISVIYNGIDPIFQPASLDERKRVISKHSLPNDYLLYIGNIKPHKNICGLIEAYNIANEEKPDIPLVIMGENSYLKSWPSHIREKVEKYLQSNKIIFTGYLPLEDLAAVYSQAMIFLFPSLYEGFGLPPLEAMSCGTPVIASNTSSLPEILEESSMYVDPTKNESIAFAMIELLQDSNLRDSFIKKGFDQVKKYSWNRAAKKHLEIYAGLLNRSNLF